jgi:hypothetical protein
MYPWTWNRGITCLATAALTLRDFAISWALQLASPLDSLRKLRAAARGNGGPGLAAQLAWSSAFAAYRDFCRFDRRVGPAGLAAAPLLFFQTATKHPRLLLELSRPNGKRQSGISTLERESRPTEQSRNRRNRWAHDDRVGHHEDRLACKAPRQRSQGAVNPQRDIGVALAAGRR